YFECNRLMVSHNNEYRAHRSQVRQHEEAHRVHGRDRGEQAVTAMLGRSLVLTALLVATVGSMIGFAAGRRPSATSAAWARRFAYAFSAAMVLAALVMEFALLTHDFSVG